MSPIKLKVCGMREPNNIAELLAVKPDYIGFIFYPRSPRFVGEGGLPDTPGVKRVGVFVNEKVEVILQKVSSFKLDFVQLHGDESPEECLRLKQNNVKVIKAFSVDDETDFSETEAYTEACEFFLFDTKGLLRGGNSERFNWRVLERYANQKPFFLSGGIGVTDVPELASMRPLHVHAIDVNSKLEVAPGIKNIEQIIELQHELKSIS